MQLFSSSLGRLLRGSARVSVLALAALYAVGATATLSPAQVGLETGPHPRITAEISTMQRVQLKESQHPLAQERFDAGGMDGRTQLHGVSLAFGRSAAQQADLNKLMAEQQNPASAQYHRWLTPEQFAARFGMAQADLDKASLWLRQQGFRVERTARSRDRIFFFGTVDQIERAFATQIHYYTVDGEKHFAPSTALSIPAALAGVIVNVGNLDSFRPRPMHTQIRTVAPDFTSATSGHHFLSPQDVATIYDVHPLWTGGYTGKGQAIAIAGQSFVDVADMEHFQLASGWASPKDPTLVLIPGSGADGIFSKGDETESDLDLEWSGTIAPDADIFFVYAGAGANYSVFDAVAYAIDERVAPIISISYGACELAIGSAASVASLESIFQKAAVQGQTLVASSGDDGASGCYRDTNLDLASRATLSAGYPASSPNFTAVGGTQFNEGSGTYWQAASGSDVISSALSYIPEVAWNEDSSSSGLGSSGGGVSAFFTKPSWQAGAPGIPADGWRDVPDISLPSAGGHDGLLFCSSDTYSWGPGQQASCSKGFRDASSGFLSVSGGTSFATPIFAGMLALIDQQQNSTGLGLINPKLYTLASDPTIYGSAFHDITGGDNRCDVPGDPTLCPNGATGYDAGTGYDLATGLGSVDVANLAAAWGSSALAPTSITITPSTTSPVNGSHVSFTVTVNDASGPGTPSGMVSVLVDGSAISPELTLSGGSASFTQTLAGEGDHIIVATYAGDGTFAASTKTLSLIVPLSTNTTVYTPTSKALVGSTVNFYADVQDSASSGNIDGTLSIVVDGTTAATLPVTNGAVVNYATSFTTLGIHTLQAVYSGSQNFATSTGVTTVNVVPVQVSTTTAVTTSTTTPVAGAQTQFTVTIKPASGTTAPDGTVTVSIAGATLTPITLANGSANFNYTFARAGTYLVQAVYSGSTAFVASTGTLKVIVSSVAPTASVTSISASSATSALGAADTFTITVASGSAGSTATPTGTIAVAVDGVAVASPLSLTAGITTYTTSFNSAGTHSVSAAYSGDGVYAASSASSTVTVAAGSFTLSATPVNLAKGGSGSSTITLTPANGYVGTVAFTVKTPATGAAGLCLGGMSNAVISGAGALTATLNVRDGQGSCPAATTVAAAQRQPGRPASPLPLDSVFAAGLLGLGLSVRRWRKRGIYVVMLAAFGIGLTLSGCGGSSGKTSSPTTVIFTVVGTDTATSSITAQTTVNVTLMK